MDQYTNNQQTDTLLKVLTHPAERESLHFDNLQRLVESFPQSGLLHALVARANNTQSINTAVTYFNPKALYQLLNAPDSFAAVADTQIIQQLGDLTYTVSTEGGTPPDGKHAEEPQPVNHDTEQVPESVKRISGEGSIEENKDEAEKSFTEAGIADNPAAELDQIIETPSGGADDEQIETVIPEEETPEQEAVIHEREPEVPVAPGKDTAEGIDDEIFEEIVSIEDIGFSQAARLAEEAAPEPATYFVFDDSISDANQNGDKESELQTSSAGTVNTDGEHQDVSRYHDEKMPYSFMWWLDKTRKEYSGIYQPYINPNTPRVADKKSPDGLQQQYYENIFHLNAIEELNINAVPQTPEFDPNRKEDVIIQRFIHEEPHIKPPSNDKLDNENKAKKSAIDQDEMVTETLARIYADQMLYHKAVNTYRKLMLKFPEKSRYFADQIEQLERKTN